MNDLKKVFSISEKKLHRLVTLHPNQFPMYTHRGRWVFDGETWTNWCEGFLGGQLWLMYQHTGATIWRDRAEQYSRLIEPRKVDRSVHDLGFLFWSTWKRWYDLTGDAKANEVVIEAGRTMALRFQKAGGYFCSFLGSNSLFIDIMMNVGIIFYAAQQTYDPSLMAIAKKHVETTRRCLVRGDGSTAHEGIFDLETGEFQHQSTQQGWRSDSAWARGQAWALYGFANAFTFTRNPDDLATAEHCAQYYIRHTPTHGIPPNDWDEPNPALPFESSAAAIAASGLLLLSRLAQDALKARYYREYALRILFTLYSNEFLAEEDDWEGLLKHGIYHQKKGLGVDESVMWGDYFFLEAVYKAMHDD